MLLGPVNFQFFFQLTHNAVYKPGLKRTKRYWPLKTNTKVKHHQDNSKSIHNNEACQLTVKSGKGGNIPPPVFPAFIHHVRQGTHDWSPPGLTPPVTSP